MATGIDQDVTVGRLRIARATWDAYVDEVVAEYGCSRRMAEMQAQMYEWAPGAPGVSWAVPTSYIVAGGRDERELQAYLGFGAAIVGARTRESNGRIVAVIEIPTEHAQWQSMRLQSGMMGGQIFDDRRAAMDELETRANG